MNSQFSNNRKRSLANLIMKEASQKEGILRISKSIVRAPLTPRIPIQGS